MDKQKLRKELNRCKREAVLDFALTKALDDCNTCTNAALAEKYGEHSTGIWVKWFWFGMNRSTWEKVCKGGLLIAHTLTKAQGQKVKEILAQTYDVDWDGDDTKCITIKEKPERRCAICRELITGHCCNAWPVAEGRCCKLCDRMHVGPARIGRPFTAEEMKALLAAEDLIRKQMEVQA
jgi:hypothetical protein